MKNIRRSFCLVLAFVFLAGLLCSGAYGAESTSDAGADYAEAIGVVTALGIVEDAQADTVTRAEALGILAKLALSPEKAYALQSGSIPFTDCDDLDSEVPYIIWGAHEGIVVGTGAKLFCPNDPVTAEQFAKMCLTFLGYGENNEFIGKGWNENVRAIADETIFAGYVGELNSSAPATAAECCLYAFNALFMEKVTWDGTAYVATDGETIATIYGWNEVDPSQSITQNGLTKVDDPFGRPTAVWSYNGQEIGNYGLEPVAKWTSNLSGATGNSTVNSAIKGYKFAEGGATLIVNGCESGTISGAGGVTGASGNGIVIELYSEGGTKQITKIVKIATDYCKVTSVSEDSVTLAVQNVRYSGDADLEPAAINGALPTFETILSYELIRI